MKIKNKKAISIMIAAILVISVFVAFLASVQASQTTVTIGNICSSETVTVPVIVNDVVEEDDITAFTVKLDYYDESDPYAAKVCKVTAITEGDIPLAAVNLWYADPKWGGWVKWCGYVVGDDGPYGDVVLGYLTFEVIGDPGDSTVLDLTVETLTSDYEPVAYTVIDGTFSIPEPIIPATVRIEPETLNLASQGVFTAFIQLPEGYDVADIGVSTVVCEGATAVRGIVDGDTFIAKFNRQNLVNVMTGDVVELTVVVELFDGTPFEGSDTIRVIKKGGKK
jgi:hypothetical protein